MSAESPETTRTFTVPNDAPEAPRTSTLTAQGAEQIPPQPSEIASEQMRHVAEAAEQGEQSAKSEEDVERLLPDPNEPFALEDGTMVTARHLRLREFLSMLKIVTRGASMAMGAVPLDVNDENFVQSLGSLFIFAIPEAEDEAVDFVRKIVDPVPPSGGWTSTEEQVKAAAELDTALENPDLGDLITIIETVLRKEGPDLRRLGKRITEAINFAQRTGQTAQS